ncbi:MAG: HEPN domain-containing protein [Myxococcota bacterium]
MHDPRTEADRWLLSAREDFDYARHAASAGHHAPACFFAQQAAEKAVKAAHFLRGARAVIGHSVRVLIEQLEPRDAAFDALLDAARELDLFYIPTRYPNGLESGTPGQAFSEAQSKRALDLASPFVAAAEQAVGHTSDGSS